MACKAGPGAPQQPCLSDGGVAVQNDALAKANSDRVAVHLNPVTGFNFDPAIQFNMRVKVRRALFDLDTAWRVKCFGGQESGHDLGASNISAKLLV